MKNELRRSNMRMRTTFAGLVIAMTAVGLSWADDAATLAAVQKAIPLLARSDQQWFTKQDCASCHQQALPILVFREARQRGVPIPEDVIREQADKTVNMYRSAGALDRAIQGSTMMDPGLSESYMLVAAGAAGLRPSPVVAARVRFIAYRQMPEGFWRTVEHRPPLLASLISSTAVTLRVIQLYLAPFTPDDAGQRVLRAKQWLLQATAFDTEDLSYQMLGLGWAGATEAEIRPIAKRLLATQQSDGGWAQIPDRPSDAYATGEALVALHQAAGMPVSDAAWTRGLNYLVKTQHSDGSWEVTTRLPEPAPVSPPYFESGFPYGHNQMISCAGTAWATMALLVSLPAAAKPDGSPFISASKGDSTEPWATTVLFGSLADTRRLLDSGWDPNSHTKGGTTALMMAAPDAAKSELLLAGGADVQARAETGYTAMMVAANYPGTGKTVRLLLERGAVVSTDKKKPALFNASPLLLAASAGDRENVALLYERDRDLKQSMLAAGIAPSTALDFALFNDDPDMVRYLVARGADVNAADDRGISELSWATLIGKPDLVKSFIALGADVNHRDKLGMTPLLWACLIDNGTSEVVGLLLRAGADTNAQTKDGLTARQLAQKYGYTSFVSALDEAKPVK